MNPESGLDNYQPHLKKQTLIRLQFYQEHGLLFTPLISIQRKVSGYNNTKRHGRIYSRSKKTPVHTGWLSRPRYWIVINWFYIDEKAPSKRYKILSGQPLCSSQQMTSEYSVSIQNTYINKIQHEDASLFLILPKE